VAQSNTESKTLQAIKQEQEIFWKNPNLEDAETANNQASYTFSDIQDVEDRLQRFASFIQIAFPETEESEGILESKISPVPAMKDWLGQEYEVNVSGDLYIKRDDLLPVSGTIKSRGAIYEVLKHAEDLAPQSGLLESTEEDYSIFASEKFTQFFANHNITVGTTGNLGISVGAMGRALGFEVTVHMSTEAKAWKKEFLKERGVEVIEHSTNFSKAVKKGRETSAENPNSYFVDDELSEELFLGYTVGGYRMKEQLAKEGIQVDQDHPLFVYLPCGIGGSPSGITFGLKHAFGDHVHCFFAEPTKMPSFLIGLGTGLFDKISVEDIGLGGPTVADGLAVPATSGLVSKLMRNYFSGGYTLKDKTFSALLTQLYKLENIFLEPAAVAGLPGPFKLLKTEDGKEYLEKNDLNNKLDQATHIAWGTGGSMVPAKDKNEFIKEGKHQTIEK